MRTPTLSARRCALDAPPGTLEYLTAFLVAVGAQRHALQRAGQQPGFVAVNPDTLHTLIRLARACYRGALQPSVIELPVLADHTLPAHSVDVGDAHCGFTDHELPAAPSTRRVHLTILRALATQFGLDDVGPRCRCPSHRVGPPETVTDVDYGNLLRAPDRRTIAGRRDHALFRVLGDCGLRNAELRGLTGRSLRRPRANSRWNLYVFGKGGTEREVPMPAATKEALDAWLASHPLADRHGGLRDSDPLFVRLGRHGAAAPGPLSNQALYKLVTRYGAATGIPDRLQHSHVLRAYYATTLVNEGVPVHIIRARLGHQSVETTMRHLAELDGPTTKPVGEVLDRRHARLRRSRTPS